MLYVDNYFCASTDLCILDHENVYIHILKECEIERSTLTS